MVKKFVIISYPRTGSTFLAKVLNSCNNIICHSEIFHPKREAFNRSFFDKSVYPNLTFIDKIRGRNPLDKLYSLRENKPTKFLNHVFRHSAEAVGFKIFPNHDNRVLTHLLKEKNIKKIILIRENLIRSFVSEQLALKTGKWDRYSFSEKPELQHIKLDIKAFLNYSERITESICNIDKQLQSYEQEFLHLTYEDITNRFPSDKLTSFLNMNLENISLDVAQKKQNPFSLSDMIENHDEVIQTLKGSSWERFFYE